MRKAILFVLSLLMAISPCFSQRTQKVGLVLSGGGARGLAHIGAIQALEENNIPIDYIAGSSVGAIVGALYASGYSVEEMKSLFLSEDFQRWLSGKVDKNYSYFFKENEIDPALVSFTFDTKNKFKFQIPSSVVNPIQMDYALMEVFAGASAVANNNFDSLMIPFFCITSDIEAGEASIRRKGDLGQAVRASMTFPFYFAPIKIDGKLMFDGGMYNNFPSKEMQEIYNPDIIIGVKISGNYPPPREGDIVSYLQNIATKETDYNITCKNSVIIEPDLKPYGILDFGRMEETYSIGYDAALEKISEIKGFQKDSINKDELTQIRENFNKRKPAYVINNVIVEGVNQSQKNYIERSLFYNSTDKNFTEQVKRNYFSLCFDRNIKSVQPYMYYNNFSQSYVLNLNVNTQESFKVKVGGLLSSNPISHLYLGTEYNYLHHHSWQLKTNIFLGRYYTSFMTGVRLDYPSHFPFFAEIEFNANIWRYYNLKTNFFDFSPLNYIVQNETNIQLNLGVPIGVKDKLVFNAGYGLVDDEYFNIKNTTIYDTADNTRFHHFVSGFTRCLSSLNDFQFPTTGIFSKIQLQYIHGKENFTPGNTSTISDPKDKLHGWMQFSFRHKQYFDITKNFAFGFNADVFYSFQNLFSNYNSTLLNAGVYTPTLETFTQFMPEYRANQYLAFGTENIFKVSFYRIDASFRLNGNLFAPISRIITKDNNIPTYSTEFFNKIYLIISSTLVFNTPIGPLSIIAGYHQRDDIKSNPFTISVNFGYVMFNRKNIDR